MKRDIRRKDRRIADSELILNPDGSVYHLKLKPQYIADTILLVGDQQRVQRISCYFDKVELKIQNREFITHTGTLKGKRVTVMSTGIGPDNMDIAVNELDALANIDLKTRTIKKRKKSLRLIRIGTSGSLQKNIPVDSMVVSRYGLGFDGILNFYQANRSCEIKMAETFIKHTSWSKTLPSPYIVKGSEELIKRLGRDAQQGITITAPGFYGPQGRHLRLPLAFPEINEKLTAFKCNGECITNYEMETSALYGLGKALGHHCCSICVIIANRLAGTHSKEPEKTVDNLIRYVLKRLF